MARPARTARPERTARHALARLSALVLLLLACTPRHGTAGGVAKPAPAPARPLRVLFIGNSFTYFNNLPALVEGLAAVTATDGARRVTTRMVAPGGAGLERHWNDPSVHQALATGDWDYVVLQEQSMLNARYLVNGKPRVVHPEGFFRYARLFGQEIHKTRAKIVLYLTWARRDAPPEDQAMLNHAYAEMARELGATLAPVGLAWQAVRKERPDLDLYYEDGSHPSPAGSYLAAAVLHATLLGRNPLGLPGRLEGPSVNLDTGQVAPARVTLAELPAEKALVLQRAAWQAHEDLRTRGAELRFPRPPPPVGPTLPTGCRPTPAELAGTWRGTLHLLFEPAVMELRLTPHGQPATWTAEVKVRTSGAEGALAPEVRGFEITETGIAFVDEHGPNGSRIQYRAAFREGTLSGIAELTAPEQRFYGIGTWELKRQP